MRLVIARTRTPITLVAMVMLLVTSFTGPGWLIDVSTVVTVAGLATMFLHARRADRPAVEVRAPVQGRWQAVNSPADKVPSHGVHAYGQTYAIDLVHVPDPDSRWTGVHRKPLARRPQEFPGFGQPVLAPANGTVVRVSDWQRDHWSRNSPLGVLYLLFEGTFREVFGVGRILGNHIVLDLGDGVYAAFAHLRRRSTLVTKGQRVTAGQRIASCGNSGNTSEPHVHFQLMDHRRVLIAAGLPFRFTDTEPGVPAAGRPFTAA